MRKIVLCSLGILVGFIFVDSAHAISSIQIIAPMSGEHLSYGKTYQIKWNSSDLQDNILIYLYKDGNGLNWITSGTSNTGTYNWSPSNTFNMISGGNVGSPDTFEIEVRGYGSPVNGQVAQVSSKSGSFFIDAVQSNPSPTPVSPTPASTPSSTQTPAYVSPVTTYEAKKITDHSVELSASVTSRFPDADLMGKPSSGWFKIRSADGSFNTETFHAQIYPPSPGDPGYMLGNTISVLKPSTTYYFQPVVSVCINSICGGTSYMHYGEEKFFTTLASNTITTPVPISPSTSPVVSATPTTIKKFSIRIMGTLQPAAGSTLTVLAGKTTYTVNTTKARIYYKNKRKGSQSILQPNDRVIVYGTHLKASADITALSITDLSQTYQNPKATIQQQGTPAATTQPSVQTPPSSLDAALGKARDISKITMLHFVAKALGSYFHDNAKFPADLAELANGKYVSSSYPIQSFNYKLSDDGLHYALFVKTETDKAILTKLMGTSWDAASGSINGIDCSNAHTFCLAGN